MSTDAANGSDVRSRAGEATGTALGVVIPAALHGSHLPRKVLRPLNDRPLLLHTIETASRVVPSLSHVAVITDDDEVALWAERSGCQVMMSPQVGADTALERKAVHDAITMLERGRGRPFDLVLILDPSAPLIEPDDLEQAVARALAGPFDSVISAAEERQRRWFASTSFEGHVFNDLPRAVPDRRFREIRGFIVSRRSAVRPGSVIGQSVGLSVVDCERAVELHSAHEWWICERQLQRRRVVFVVAGHRAIGMGHIYRVLQLAHEIHNHELTIACTQPSDLAARMIAGDGYATVVQGDEPLEQTVLALRPALVINDILDTDAGYVEALKASGATVVTFEDLGTGATAADLVFNDLYTDTTSQPNHRVGPEFSCTRDEFFEIAPGPFRDPVREVLVTFGGADEDNLTARVLRVIWPEAKRRGVAIRVVTGAGYVHDAELEALISSLDDPLVRRTTGTKRMSDYMARADLAFSSAGRTLFELATLRVPGIVMACNGREGMHPFASSHEGFRFLGRHTAVADAAIAEAFLAVATDATLRLRMRTCLAQFDFSRGKRRILDEIAKAVDFSLL